MSEENKEHEYAGKILTALSGLFDEENDFYIDFEDLAEGDNMTHFTHALANIAPMHFIKEISDQKGDILVFNQMYNRLIFQYQRKKHQSEEK